MKKMPTLFERQFENHEIIKCLNKVHDGCEWVLNGEGYATEKLDGTCYMIKSNQLLGIGLIGYYVIEIIHKINIILKHMTNKKNGMTELMN